MTSFELQRPIERVIAAPNEWCASYPEQQHEKRSNATRIERKHLMPLHLKVLNSLV